MNPIVFFGETDLDPIQELLFLHLAAGGKLTEYTVNGNPVSFNTNVAKPLSVLAAFSPVQTGSGDPSPQNIRPITGFTGANITRCGKNLFNKDDALLAVEKAYLEASTGKYKVSNSLSTRLLKIPCKPSTKYTISNGITTTIRIASFTETPTDNTAPTEKNAPSGATTAGTGLTITTGAADVWLYVQVFANDDTGVDYATATATLMIELGESASAFEAYNVQVVTVTFPNEAGTVSAGTLDLTTGELTITAVLASLKNRGWYNYSRNTTFAWNAGKDKNSSILCDSFPVFLNNTSQDESILAYANGAGYAGNIYFYKTGLASAEEFNAWINGLEFDPHICYALPTPKTYQLTPTEILSLIGNNVIWSDLNGNLTVKYLKKG